MSENDASDKQTTDQTEENSVRLPNPEQLIVSTSPHLHGGGSISKIMLIVIISLLPACGAGIYYFGLPALEVLLLCVISCVGLEMLWCLIAGSKQTWKDGSAVVTGLLLGMNLSAGVPWWVCVIGGVLAIGLGKQIFGGIGYNPFNPALVARVGLLIGFPKIMTTWVVPRNFSYMLNAKSGFLANPAIDKLKDLGSGHLPFSGTIDGVTCATPLGIVNTTAEMAKDAGTKLTVDPFAHIANATMYHNYFWGNVGGCLGETSVFFLLVGAAILFAFKIIRWRIPIAYVGTVAVITYIAHTANPALTPGPLFHVLTGGLILGAFFMATDMVTSPMTNNGAVIFGIGCGVITCCIRIWGSYPEGVSFSILLMNAVVPLIDRYTTGKPFGYIKPAPQQ